MKYALILLALLLTATPALAGPEFLACIGKACKAQTGTVNNLGGVTSINADAVGDTGTATPSTLSVCGGTVSVSASCYGGTGGSYGDVYLKINGSIVQTLHCAVGETKSSVSLTWPVSGRYTAQVLGIAVGDSDFSATLFSFPVAQ